MVKVGERSLGGARFILDEPTDYKPWPDSDRYVNSLTIKDIEYCNPFDISVLSEAGGKYWAITLLIPQNRLFKTAGFKVDRNNVQEIRTIPDGLLIAYDRKFKNPFRINLIEYECYGERKQKEIDKSTYLNSIIIPQLMRFASAFSIITDEQTRIKTIESWVENNNLCK